MADQPPTLTAVALHNALAAVTMAYGGALADKEREVALLKAQNAMLQGMLDVATKELNELRVHKPPSFPPPPKTGVP